MKGTVKPVPAGYHTVTPYLVVENASALIEFLIKVFGAQEVLRMPQEDGRIIHAEVRIGDSVVMMSDALNNNPPMPTVLHIYLEDTDSAFQRALDAGAIALREPEDQFYGDRTAGVQDVFGNQWWIATHIEDVPAGEHRELLLPFSLLSSSQGFFRRRAVFDIITQIQYNNWANKRILSAAVNIPPDQLTANADLSYGSAFETLRHMLDVEWSWRLACEEIPATELLWNIEPLDDLIAVTSYWEAEGERLLAFASVLPEEDFTREVTPSWMKLSCQIQHILMHIVHHATDHRSEVGWHLTRLGHSPGDLGFLEFINSLQK